LNLKPIVEISGAESVTSHILDLSQAIDLSASNAIQMQVNVSEFVPESLGAGIPAARAAAVRAAVTVRDCRGNIFRRMKLFWEVRH
jgi:hypothetical protein